MGSQQPGPGAAGLLWLRNSGREWEAQPRQRPDLQRGQELV